MKRFGYFLVFGVLAWLAGMAEVTCGQSGAFPVQVPVVSLGFRNDTKGAIIVQGASKLHNQIRRGQPVVVAPGKIGYDINVPHGIRFITIYDATQPSRVMLVNFPVPVTQRATYSVAHGTGGQTHLRPISVP